MRVFVYCDDPSHTKRIAVTNFLSEGGGRWSERYTSAAQQGRADSGLTLDGDRPWTAGQLDHPAELADLRSRYRIECRKCRDRNAVVAREKKLHAALTALAAHGVAEVSLSLLAATLQRQSDV